MMHLKEALRSLRNRPGYCAAVILAGALAVAACASIFPAIYTLALAPLPIPGSSRVARVFAVTPTEPSGQMSAPDAESLATCCPALAQVGLFTAQRQTLNGGLGYPLLVNSAAIGPRALAIVQPSAILGRTFGPSDYATGKSAVISASLWRARFNSSARIIGTVIYLNAKPATIVGVVTSAAMRLSTGPSPQVWTPLQRERLVDESRASRRFSALARLAPGISWQTATKQLASEAARLAVTQPSTNSGIAFTAVPLREVLDGPVHVPLLALWAAAIALMLVVCLNSAILSWIRGRSTQRDLATRRALGASQFAASAHRFWEAAILASLAGGGGGVLGWVIAQHLASIAATLGWPHLRPHSGLLIAVAAAAAAVFALALLPWNEIAVPANRARPARLGYLVALQTAVASALCVIAAVLALTMHRYASVPIGFSPRNVVDLDFDPTSVHHPSLLYAKVLSAISAIPNVQSAALTSSLPMWQDSSVRATIPADNGSPRNMLVQYNFASIGYLHTFEIPLLGGRDFTDTDNFSSPRVVLVNAAAARALGKGGPVSIGRNLEFGFGPLRGTWRIVGVVGDTLSLKRGDQAAQPQVIFPLAQISEPGPVTIAVRSRSPQSIIAPIRAAVAHLDRRDALSPASLLSHQLAGTIAAPAAMATIIEWLALATIFLAAMGLTASVANAATARRHELAVRAVLGARPAQLVAALSTRTATFALAGSLIGLFAGVAAANLLKSLLFRTEAASPIALAASALLITAIVAISASAPALLACRRSPATDLRISGE